MFPDASQRRPFRFQSPLRRVWLRDYNSTGRPDYTESVPTELLLHTLSTFSFDELLPLLAVSRRWRNIAIDSAPYWSFIELGSLREAEVNLFVTRVSRALQRPVAVDVHLGPRYPVPSASQVQALQARILSTLHNHLHHVLHLDVRVLHPDTPALWNALDVPAPQLRSLTLLIEVLIGEGLPVAPALLFAGHAPDLRTVSLMNVDLPGQPVLVFSKVTKLDLEYYTPIPDIFPHFPVLEAIKFPFGALLVHPAFHEARSYRTVRNCMYHSNRMPHLPPQPVAPTRDVEFVTISCPRAGEIAELVGPLRAPISLTYRPCPDYPTKEFELLFVEVDATTARSRLVIDVVEAWLDELYSDLQPALCAALAGKLHTLEIDAAHWETFLRCMPAVLSGMQRVRIAVSEHVTVAALPRVKVPTADLRTLELVAARCMWISERDITDFSAESFDAAALGETTLVLYNIHLDGSALSLRSVFKDVSTVHSPPCRISSSDRGP